MGNCMDCEESKAEFESQLYHFLGLTISLKHFLFPCKMFLSVLGYFKALTVR